ncbi:unnamed protein product [Cylindrotheca closterium]|uniref:Uncharacterized protein n=1 Tax=Cylindrotheca closterium TaxID=2856 RepID=A0AAD2FSH3_9STRA|nr:unnamed protein product [Cylindrotheca closterium]
MKNKHDNRKLLMCLLLPFAAAVVNFSLSFLLVTHNDNHGNLNSHDPSLSNTKNSPGEKIGNPLKNKRLRLLLAKTISTRDVDDTVHDIKSIQMQHSEDFHIEWKVFCYKNETYQSILSTYSEAAWKEQFNTEIHFWPGKNKINFWHRFLKPELIPDYIDYLWMMDGDIRLRNMAWDCFWDTALTFKPAIFAPTIMSSLSYKTERRKLYTGSTHPHQCYNTSYIPQIKNDFQRLVAMDVWVIEIQLPVFNVAAWETIYKVFSENVPGWGDFESMWGPDLYWCKLVDHHLLNVKDTERERLQGRPRMHWDDVKETCSFDDSVKYPIDEGLYLDNTGPSSASSSSSSSSSGPRQLPHACMIMHSTPVEHLDTKTIDSHLKGPNKVGPQDEAQYQEAFPEFVARLNAAHRHVYRAYFSDDPERYNCQACKHAGCLTESD